MQAYLCMCSLSTQGHCKLLSMVDVKQSCIKHKRHERNCSSSGSADAPVCDAYAR